MRICIVPLCGLKAKRATCCNQLLCDGHAESVRNHDCPAAKRLEEIASDPKKLKAWREEHSPEQVLTTQVIGALNALPGVEVWRAKRQPKAHQKDDTTGVLDVVGHAAPDGRAIYVETKRDHKDDCPCGSCANQRDFAERARARGCVVVLGARTVQKAVDGVQMGLARARGSERRAG